MAKKSMMPVLLLGGAALLLMGSKSGGGSGGSGGGSGTKPWGGEGAEESILTASRRPDGTIVLYIDYSNPCLAGECAIDSESIDFDVGNVEETEIAVWVAATSGAKSEADILAQEARSLTPVSEGVFVFALTGIPTGNGAIPLLTIDSKGTATTQNQNSDQIIRRTVSEISERLGGAIAYSDDEDFLGDSLSAQYSESSQSAAGAQWGLIELGGVESSAATGLQ